MSTASEIITSIGLSSGDALIQDVKGSITTYTKDGTGRGHFNVANSAVEPGCVIAFADASTATICAKSGDGTGASSILLSVDHATDSSLANITGIVYSSPNAQINQGTSITEQSWSCSLSTNTTGGEGYGIRVVHSADGLNATQVRVTLTPNTGGTTQFTHVCFAERGSGGNAAGTFGGSQFKEFLFGGNTGVTLAANTPQTSDWLTFTKDGTKDYLTVFAFAGSNGNGRNGTGGNRYYKAAAAGDYNVQNISGYTNDSNNTCVTKIEVRTVANPAAIYAAYTNAIQLNTSTFSSINGITATQTLNGASIWHAMSFNKGNAAELWWVYLSSAWRSIVALTSGTWQYRDAGGTLQNATVNSRLGALAQAFSIAQNQLSATALAAITSGQWATPFVAGTLDFACGLQASGNNLPTLSQWTITYTPVTYGFPPGPGHMEVVSAWGFIV